jgi:multidrug efflux pump
VVLVGLACKNAILIVEYAKTQSESGQSRLDATLSAVKLRLRPIIMTSFAFILGVVPLMVSEGAGAEMRRALGTAVFAGMLGVTLFGIFLTPVFYYVIQWFKDRRAAASGEADGQQDDNRVAHILTDLDHRLNELAGQTDRGRLSPDQVAILERGLSRIQQVLHAGRNGDTSGNGQGHS